MDQDGPGLPPSHVRVRRPWWGAAVVQSGRQGGGGGCWPDLGRDMRKRRPMPARVFGPPHPAPPSSHCPFPAAFPGAGTLTPSCCGFGLMELSWRSRLPWGAAGGAGLLGAFSSSRDRALQLSPCDLTMAPQGAQPGGSGPSPHEACLVATPPQPSSLRVPHRSASLSEGCPARPAVPPWQKHDVPSLRVRGQPGELKWPCQDEGGDRGHGACWMLPSAPER